MTFFQAEVFGTAKYFKSTLNNAKHRPTEEMYQDLLKLEVKQSENLTNKNKQVVKKKNKEQVVQDKYNMYHTRRPTLTDIEEKQIKKDYNKIIRKLRKEGNLDIECNKELKDYRDKYINKLTDPITINKWKIILDTLMEKTYEILKKCNVSKNVWEDVNLFFVKLENTFVLKKFGGTLDD